MVIVGNKVDKAEKNRQIRVDVGREYALSVGASFIECSAKTKEGVEELFREVSQKLVQNKKNIAKAPISATITGNVGSDSSQSAINLQSNEKGGDVINDSCC